MSKFRVDRGEYIRSVAAILSTLIFLLAAQSAYAQEWPAYSAEGSGSPELRGCLVTNPSNVEQGQCLAKAYTRENRRMEEAFAESLEGSTPAEKAQPDQGSADLAGFPS